MKLGCDPELFLVDHQGRLVSSIGKIGGSKEFPAALPIGKGFAVQEDNVAIEFNIPASGSKLAFIRNVGLARDYLSGMVGSMGLAFSHLSAANFPDEELKDPAALEFGCDPDFNAWTGEVNPRPCATDATLRSAGGHIHVGHKFNSPEDVLKFMRFMDLSAGVGSVLMDKDGGKRRQLYGKPGAFRLKPYGGEYRTLSNFWVFSDDTIGWAWDATAWAMDAWQNNKINIDELRDPIIQCITDDNKGLAQELVKTYNIPVLQ